MRWPNPSPADPAVLCARGVEKVIGTDHSIAPLLDRLMQVAIMGEHERRLRRNAQRPVLRTYSQRSDLRAAQHVVDGPRPPGSGESISTGAYRVNSQCAVYLTILSAGGAPSPDRSSRSTPRARRQSANSNAGCFASVLSQTSRRSALDRLGYPSTLPGGPPSEAISIEKYRPGALGMLFAS